MKRLVITIIFAFALFVDLFGRQMNNNDEVCEVAAVHFPQLNETVDNEDDEERIALFVFYKNMENVKVVLYEKLPIDGARLREILTLTQALKRNSLIPDSITYGVANEPELSYGNVKVKMGSLELLTQKVERLAKIKPKLKGLNGTLHLENWTEETTNIVFDKTEDKKKDKKK